MDPSSWIESETMITLSGQGNGGPSAQIDYIEFIPLQPKVLPDLTAPVNSEDPIVPEEALLETVRETAQSYLRPFLDLPNVSELMEQAFGEGSDDSVVHRTLKNLVYEDGLSHISIELVDDLPYQGGYSPDTNTIYLSRVFVETALERPQDLAAVVLQELGHWLDGVLTQTDSAGDEGAVFAALVLGQELDDERLTALKDVSDQDTLVIDGGLRE